MQNWKLTLAYDGSDYSGWQIQPCEPTIQGELQAALGRICGETPLPQGSGRTDAGVHALGQVASIALRAPIPAGNLLRALNKTLPEAIRILEARPVADAFHARHSAVAKTYEYRIFRGAICPPTLARFVHSCTWKLDRALLNEAAAAVMGEHDFTSFAATDADAAQRASAVETEPSAIRRIFVSRWEDDSPETGALLIYRVRGNGFLHHMVRNLVGTMLEIGRGQVSAGSMTQILAAKKRSVAGPTAPARGLFLHSVEYGGADATLLSGETSSAEFAGKE
jgi:tRNA pseudouridine38-40 synthase